ncbi:MAG: Uma2 family endonuclease [Gemmatimonadota bacterium]|nr:Uma2 family endonuclease [Gemmatimonadota bacterium]MDH3368852.1 Uma2 family endonuclease [Gemmatimonadota bacterium]MDH3478459.1 Uma2 family endonuclease [Gemmatimonadota bacterium]MDH3570759.1 Uma2 family endonuclease [Gemmatimonadota bacterium]MDH5549896.1 Uma2 family endonuclease [Gemmatimonadota bacterium]
MGMAIQVPCYTAAEVRGFDNPRLRFEVIRGELLVTPAPGTLHQRMVVALLRALQDYVERHGIGEALVAPFEVEFADDTAVQPDVLVILADRADRLEAERLYGAPSLVVEVVSYSSKRVDRLQKRELYLTEGVGEYWVVDPGLRRVERWIAGAVSPELSTNRLEWCPDTSVPPLDINLHELFDRAHRGLGKG